MFSVVVINALPHRTYREALLVLHDSSNGDVHFDAAIEDATKAIMFDPASYQPYCTRGFALTEKNYNEEALLDINKAIELNP